MRSKIYVRLRIRVWTLSLSWTYTICSWLICVGDYFYGLGFSGSKACNKIDDTINRKLVFSYAANIGGTWNITKYSQLTMFPWTQYLNILKRNPCMKHFWNYLSLLPDCFISNFKNQGDHLHLCRADILFND